MLLDLHVQPGDLSPEELARRVAAAGLDGAVVAQTHRTDQLDDYLDALGDADLVGFAGVEMRLERGSLLLIPKEADDTFYEAHWAPGVGKIWTLADALEHIAGFEGAIIAAHPYFRTEGTPALGDRVYAVKGLTGVECRVGRGRPTWDTLADELAEKRNLARVGGCGGDAERLGFAATVMPDDLEDEGELVEALDRGAAVPVEFDDSANRRDRSRPEAAPRPRRDDKRGGRGGRDDKRGGGRGRGGRDDKRGGGRRR